MDRGALEKYIGDTYAAEAEFPWVNYPAYAVFRHANNKKWFAVVMEVPRTKLGAPGDGMLDILNVKCGPILIGSFRSEPGIYPAYHMNKSNWLSVALDGSAEDEKIKLLLDMSYELTALRPKKRKRDGGAG